MLQADCSEPVELAQLFCPQPRQWGLRGDPLLWAEMQAFFQQDVFAAGTVALQDLLEKTFSELTGYSLDHEQPFYLERFDTGGLSRGLVSPDFWCKTAIPLLLKHYERLQNSEPI